MPPIVLRAAGADDNVAGGSEFVSIPVPAATQDGDLALVGISLPAADIVVTPPEGWDLVVRSNPALGLSIAVYQHLCLSEQTHWVFALDSSVEATGIALVYGSTDSFGPVEAHSVKLTSSGTSHNVGAISPAQDGEQLALFMAADTSGSWTTASGFSEQASHALSGSSSSAQDFFKSAAGTLDAFSETFSTTAAGASVLVALRPGVGRFTLEQVRERIIRGFPDGVEDVYDLSPSGDYGKLISAIALELKVQGFDLADLVRQESFPSKSRYVLAEWEHFFGLDTTRLARVGTIPQRQAQLVAAFRLAAGQEPSLPEIRALVGAYLGYTDPDSLLIVETSRTALRALHSYSRGPYTIPGSGSLDVVFLVPDGPRISQSGVQLSLFIDHPSAEDLSFDLVGPLSAYGQASKSWIAPFGVGAIVSTDELRIYDADAKNKTIFGAWKLTITSSGASGTLTEARLFVEGVGRGIYRRDGRAAPIFDWGVFVDPTLVNGGAGGAVDYVLVQRILDGFNQAHCKANVIRGSETINPGIPEAIPGDPGCIAGQCIPRTA